jgi:serine protease Do
VSGGIHLYERLLHHPDRVEPSGWAHRERCRRAPLSVGLVAALLGAQLVASCRMGVGGEGDVSRIARAALPSVVKIVTSGEMAQGVGSGFYLRGDDGKSFILTSNHVVWGANRVSVERDDGSIDDAVVVGTDPMADLAVLRPVSSGVTTYLTFGDDVSLARGDRVVAIGSPRGVRNAVTAGIVAARGAVPEATLASELFVDYVLTDATLSSGNSGGPLLNSEGAVVGVNEAIVGGNAALGVAMPSRLARRIFDVIARGRDYAHSFGGFRATDDPAHPGVAVLASISPGGPAAAVDLRVGDRLVTVDGATRGAAELQLRQFMDGPGTKWVLGVERSGLRLVREIVLGPLAPGDLPR